MGTLLCGTAETTEGIQPEKGQTILCGTTSQSQDIAGCFQGASHGLPPPVQSTLTLRQVNYKDDCSEFPLSKIQSHSKAGEQQFNVLPYLGSKKN